ncbi:MAG TPA: TetR/AcrR family transcriptional regulator [Candidatus Binataceae bacterium]
MTREELIKEYRFREILEAARRVIGRHGFQGTTIDRVAEEARIAKGTVYLYFSNKDDLLHVAIRDGLQKMIAETRENDDPSDPPLERIKALVRTGYRIQSTHQDFIKAFLLEPSFVSFEPGNERGAELRRIYAGHLEFIASMLQAAIDAGAIRKIDPQFGAFMLTALLTGSLQRRLMNFVTTPLEEDADAVLELFLRGVQAVPCNGNK